MTKFHISLEVADAAEEQLNALAKKEFRSPKQQLEFMVATLLGSMALLEAPVQQPQVNIPSIWIDDDGRGDGTGGASVTVSSHNSYADAQEMDGFHVGEDVLVSGEHGIIQDLNRMNGLFQVMMGDGIGEPTWFTFKDLEHVTAPEAENAED